MDNKNIKYIFEDIIITEPDGSDEEFDEILYTLMKIRNISTKPRTSFDLEDIERARQRVKEFLSPEYIDETSFIVWKDKKFAGVMIYVPATDTRVPTVNEVYIVPEYRNRLILVCMIDYFGNVLNPIGNGLIENGYKQSVIKFSQFMSEEFTDYRVIDTTLRRKVHNILTRRASR